MTRIRTLIGLAAVLALSGLCPQAATAQGVTTGALTGTVTDATGLAIESAQIQVRNTITGYNVGTQTRASGLFIIQGIEPNSNYKITVRRIGFSAMTRDGITIALFCHYFSL